jgi:hypothetical protein
MSRLLAALLDPMVIEATLLLPSAPATVSLPGPAPSHQTAHVKWVGPDGVMLLPEDTFHCFDEPSTFGPNSDWLSEMSSHNNSLSPSEPTTILDANAEATDLPSGHLDSPPCQEIVYVDL